MQVSWQEKRVVKEILESKVDRDAKKAFVGSSDTPGGSLLDSSLITEYDNIIFDDNIKKKYNVKVIKCGDYIQTYFLKL